MVTEILAQPRRLRSRCALLALLIAPLSGCGTLYIAQAAQGQIRVLRARAPISTVIADPATSAKLRSTLQTVLDARNYASRELGLPDNQSYRSYAQLDRPYVVWNVVATPEFSVEPRRWCFPVAGCVAYRGYFQEARARHFANALASIGDDVTVYGVSAYSTLGKFADPVLSSMIGYGEVELAAIIFHELAHQLIYVKNDSSFNESFATVVEETGLRRWLAAQGKTAELQRHIARQLRQSEVVRSFSAAREELALLYSTQLQKPEMRTRKREILEMLARQIEATERRDGASAGYDAWLREGLNNAHLASIGTYFDCVPGFERLLTEAGGNLPVFYARVRTVARLKRSERQTLLCMQAM